MISPSGLRVDCIPDDRSMPGYTVMRDEFDHLLFQKAREAGAETRSGSEVTGASQDADGVSVMTADGETITGRFLVGADGTNGTVARKMGFYSGWSGAAAGVAIEVEIEVGSNKVREVCGEPSGYDADLFFLYLGHVSHGYTWCFPKRTVLSLGAWSRQDLAKNLRQIYNDWFEQFCTDHDIEPRILSDSAARFPVRPSSTLVRGRTVLVGDAGGLVDAFTGEGIPHAIRSGILAADAIKRASDASDPRLLRRYEDSCRKEILPELAVSEYMAKLFYKSTKNMETLCRFLYEDSYASYLIAAAVGGLMTQREVKRKMMLRMLRTRPRAAISLLL